MRKIIIVGSGGAGKTTLARRLGEATGIEVIHLDSLFWRPNWTRTPEEEWISKVESLVKCDSWIMDGNFGGTREIRLAACDTIIWLDTPRHVCLYRALKRTVTYHNRTRPDMAEGCNEKLDWEFLRWIWEYPSRIPRLLEQIKNHSGKRLIVIRSEKDVEALLAEAAEIITDGVASRPI